MKMKYTNFRPTDAFQLYADALLGRLRDLAPSNAATFSTFEKRGNRYLCKIEINSEVERFEAFIESVDPIMALERARRRISVQITRWHRRRFPSLALS